MEESVKSAFVSTTMVQTLPNCNNKIYLKVNEQNVLFLIDTGSSINVMSGSLAERLNCAISPLLRDDYDNCTLANGSRAEFLGTTETNVTFPTFARTIRFYVLSSVLETAIIGCETLTKMRAVIDFSKNGVCFDDAYVNFLVPDDVTTGDDVTYANVVDDIDDNCSIFSENDDNNECIVDKIHSLWIEPLH